MPVGVAKSDRERHCEHYLDDLDILIGKITENEDVQRESTLH